MGDLKRRFVLAAAVLGAIAWAPGRARADLIIEHFSEVNGPTRTGGFPAPETQIGTDTFTIPAGQTITSATLAGTFGQTSTFFGSTAEFTLLLNHSVIGSTASVTPDPFNNVVPFSFSLTPSLLAGGSADLTYIQTSEFNVRLSQTTLTINTAVIATPEPSTVALALSALPVGLAVWARRRRRAA